MQEEPLTSAAWTMGMILAYNQHFRNVDNNIILDHIS